MKICSKKHEEIAPSLLEEKGGWCNYVILSECDILVIFSKDTKEFK